MKTFSKLTKENKDLIYLLNIDGHTLKLIKPFNSISCTYGSLCLTVYDDSFETLKNNMWLLDLQWWDDISEQLKFWMLFEIPADNLQTLLYS